MKNETGTYQRKRTFWEELCVMFPFRKMSQNNSLTETKPEQKKSIEKMGKMTLISIIVQFAGITFCSFIYYAFIGQYVLEILGFIWSATIVFALTLVTWSYILLKTPMYSWWFIEVNPNFGVVVGKQINNDQTPAKAKLGEIDERTKMFHLPSLREIQSGIHGKWPWEIVVGEPINMQSELLIGNDQANPLVVYTKDGIELNVQWQDIITPLRGELVNLVRHTEAQILNFFRAKFQGILLNWFKTHNEGDVFNEQFAVKTETFFSQCLGGPNQVCPDEENHGVFTNTPQFKAVIRTADYQKAAQSKKVMMTVGESLPLLTQGMTAKQRDNVDPNMLLYIGASTAGMIQGEPIFLFGSAGDLSAKAALIKSHHEIKNSKNKGK